MKFRKIPTIVYAVFFDGTPRTAVKVFDHFDIPGGKFVPAAGLESGHLTIPTIDGDDVASAGDWIVRNPTGTCFPCPHDEFVANYEPAEVVELGKTWPKDWGPAAKGGMA